MLVKIYGSAVYGVDAITITVEVSVTNGLHTFVVGLPDNAIKESIQRVESAIKSNGFYMPRTKLVINLAPANIKKSGSAFDLPIALGILGATGQIPNPAVLEDYLVMGELGLDGKVQPIHGSLSMALQAQKENFRGLVLPAGNAPEVSLVENLTVHSVSHLMEVIALIGRIAVTTPGPRSGNFRTAPKASGIKSIHSTSLPYPDFKDVQGQENIKRALEIAAAGGHNIILIGSPGSGKSMLAKRLPGILPPLSVAEALETTKIHKAAGTLPESIPLLTQRPFRSPHHTISSVGLAGGGNIPKPGEISLAHNGVLFLDEFPEFTRSAMECLRQPMEDGMVTISRARQSMDFPARFILVAAMNPCPCGYHKHGEKICTCPPAKVYKYISKISGPLLDRFDLHIEVKAVPFEKLKEQQEGNSSAVIRERVLAARQIQAERFRFPGSGWESCNARMTGKMIKKVCRIDEHGEKLLARAMADLHLSARAYDIILKVGRTIADLEGSTEILFQHIAEATGYRSLDIENMKY